MSAGGGRVASSSKTARHEGRRVRLVGAELVAGERRIALSSAAVHYFRLPVDAWRPALEGARSLGVSLVETYVPWGVHEVSRGVFDFGSGEPRRHLRRFVEMAGELGLHVFLRPGPQVNAELTRFGLPERITHDEDCLARSPAGEPVLCLAPPLVFPVPSYASEAYRQEAGQWFDAVGREVAQLVWPDGPIVLTQVDNEAAFWFRDAPYDQDHHPDALRAYRAFLERRYEALDALGETYESGFRSWDDVRPPTDPIMADRPQLRRRLDWVAFQQQLLRDALADLARRLAGAGFEGLPTVHNLPPGDEAAPCDAGTLGEVVDRVGLDYYQRPQDVADIKRGTLRLAGTTDGPIAIELGAGCSPWLLPRSDEDSLSVALAALAYGLRGFNLYMAVDRDRWVGAPFDDRGQPRPIAARWRQLIASLRDVGFHQLERRAEVALVLPREYALLSRAAHSLSGFGPNALAGLGRPPHSACHRQCADFADPIQHAWGRWLGEAARTLDEHDVPYVYVDSSVDAARLSGMRLLLTPSYEFADRARWELLQRCAREGARIVYGPRMPELDEHLAPAELQRPEGGVFVESEAALGAHLGTLLGELARPCRVTPAHVDACVHEADGRARLVALVNRSPEGTEARLRLREPRALTDMLTGRRFAARQELLVPMTPWGTRLLTLADDDTQTTTGGTRP